MVAIKTATRVEGPTQTSASSPETEAGALEPPIIVETSSAATEEAASLFLEVIAYIVASHYLLLPHELPTHRIESTHGIQPLHVFLHLAKTLSALPDDNIAAYFDLDSSTVARAQHKIAKCTDFRVNGNLERLLAHLKNPQKISQAEEAIARAKNPPLSIDEIQIAVCGHFEVKQIDLISERRAVAIARPRQVAMYLAKRLTTRSLPEIGRKFGNRDHSTVIHAVRRIEDLRTKDRDVDAAVRILQRQLAPELPKPQT